MNALTGRLSRTATVRWRWHHVLQAPHRLGFLLAVVVLVASGLWWALVQADRAGAGLGLGYAVSPSLVHAAVMSFGFMPLFFAGFLFTAGPRWLDQAAPTAVQVLPALLAQAGGWLVWLVAAHLHAWLAVAGLGLVLGGLGAVTHRFWGLVRASTLPDRLHAQVIAWALVAGCAALAGLALATTMERPDVARLCVLSGLWAFVVVVYLSVAHRMIPFFTASALPGAAPRRDEHTLGLMLGVAGFEALAPWVEALAGTPTAWLVVRGALELAAGGVLLWLAVAWGLVKSLKIRLLAMLHLGFVWLGLALALAGAAHLIAAVAGEPVLPLAALHALTIGCLGSLMLAMVTRVSCGHSGRALVADNLVWALFWLLQATAVLRVAAAVPGLRSQPLLTASALLWATVMLLWGTRHARWYGRPRSDGRPG